MRDHREKSDRPRRWMGRWMGRRMGPWMAPWMAPWMERTALLLILTVAGSLQAAETCFESRENGSRVQVSEDEAGRPNVKCSETTGGVLWWGDPYDGTVPMGEMSVEADYSHAEAVVKPRDAQMNLYSVCGTACHNGSFPPPSDDNTPRTLTMHQDLVPDALNLQHGRGAVWCLDCHHPETRNKFVDHNGGEIEFNSPQVLCGKCHGPLIKDWRQGLHGKRIGEWASTGKKRWFVCTECHNPHDVQQGDRESGFAQIQPEPPPQLPKGMENADHERHH